ncbi:MAG: DUF4244 domain-containing protein [Actinomycetaceae bacterium]|nr:DUF4244 domain-containing protein [Actinomycetaceae bacterium]
MKAPTELVSIEGATREEGMATAEYAMGTMTATGIAGILWWLIHQPWFKEGFVSIFKKIFVIG